ncbi:MAG: hypothetical protein V4456_17515 [Bacteroidota bacterium]
MKKIFILLLILPFLIAGCRKDPAKRGDTDTGKGELANYSGYFIQGMMKDVIVTDGGREKPFIMLLKDNHKAVLVNVNGETSLSYSVQDGRIVLDDNGYFNVKNGQITDWLIAGFNFTKATLHAKVETNQLKGKKFGGSQFYVKLGASIYSEIKFETSGDLLSNPRADDPNKTYGYNSYANVAGFRHSNEYDTNDFFVIEDGKLQIAGYSAFNGLSVGSMDQIP